MTPDRVRQVIYSPTARAEIQDAYTRLAQLNPDAAGRLVGSILRTINRLRLAELTGRTVRIKGGEVQTWPVPPFRIYYLLSPDTIEIVRVYHQARRPIEQ